MEKKYLDIICCPFSNCRGLFSITETKTEGDDVIEGTLHCKKCGREFPIRDGTAILVPDGIPPETIVPIRFVDDPVERRRDKRTDRTRVQD